MGKTLISAKPSDMAEFLALTSAGRRDRREEFSKPLTKLVKKLERKKRQELLRRLTKPRSQNQDKSEVQRWVAML